jgi:RHS repeat-associated protein
VSHRAAWPREHGCEGPPGAKRTGRSPAALKPGEHPPTPDEERLIRRDPVETRHFVTDLYQRAVDTGTSTTREERFLIYAGDRQLGEIVRKNGVDETLYFHTDHLGSVELISNDMGETFSQTFDTFGALTSSAITRSGYTGHQHEADLRLIDMRGRMYDPLAGRFMSSDPVMQAPFWSQGLNPHSYVFNDPINMTDPSGYSASDWLTGVGRGLSAVWLPLVPIVGVGGIGGGIGAGSFGLGLARAGAGHYRVPGSQGSSTQLSPVQDGALPPELLGPDQRTAAIPICGGPGHIPGQTACVPAGTSALDLPGPGAGVVVRGASKAPGLLLRFGRWLGGLFGKGAARAAPKIPFKGFQEWGRPLWGRGPEGATKALENLTRETARAVDPAKARQAAEFYKQAAASGRGGEAALERVRLMERILELQR